jgi:anti-anti-sigma factor
MDGFEILPVDSPPGFRLAGELDMATVPKLEEALATWDTSQPCTLDMNDLTFMDGSAAHVILRHAKAMNGVGPLVLEGPTGLPLRVLEVLGFADMGTIRIRSMRVVHDG